MNEQIKQRLVGAVVLVSLAVIFIPMLLDGGDDSSMPRYGSNIPPQPEFNFEPLEIPLQPVEPIANDRPQVIDEVEPTAQPEQSQPAESKSSENKPLVQPTDTAAAKTDKPEEIPTSIPKTAGEPVAWVVQVGSFSQSANALGLRDKLRKNGFTAFVEKYTDSGKTSYRVRVGPELKRETAEQMMQRLQDKMQLKGIIMGHP